jgi:hypothetical protein
MQKLLAILDRERRSVVREWSTDRSECRIAFATMPMSSLAEAIRDEQAKARSGSYVLEWKWYAHDGIAGLAEALSAAGFEGGPVESVLGLELDEIDWAKFERPSAEIRTKHDHVGAVSTYVAYVDGEAVSRGRIHYGRTDGVAELAGGRTERTHRKRGLFTAIVVERLQDAAAKGCRYVFVDALPTSEPILTKLGFVTLTSTRPFIFDGRA